MDNATATRQTSPKPTTARSHKDVLYDLNGWIDAYRQAKKQEVDKWRYAESNAEEARGFARAAAEAMHKIVELVRTLAGVECMNALRLLCQSDLRFGEFPPAQVPTHPEEDPGPRWDEDDQVALSDDAEED